jgi:very-short-patch-repair endonuclease
MKNWADWKRTNKDRIAHPAGFEERFVDDILSQIDLITPSDVHSQVHFLDAKGCNRYIDFFVVNQARGWNLPIELDGYSKITDGGHGKWNDFLERQNALIAKFGTLLRYSNKQMLDTPEAVRQEIRTTLQAQSAAKIRDASQREARERIIQDYEEKLRLSASESADAQKIKSEIQEIKAQLGSIRAGAETPPQTESTSKWLCAAAAALLVAVVVFFVPKQHDAESRTYAAVETASKVPQNQQHVVREIEASRLPASEAAKYVGRSDIYFCGRIVKVVEFSRGVYLNFDKPYPNQNLTGVVWDDRRHAIANLPLEGREWCVTGAVTEYKGRPQIVIQTRDQINNAD